MKINHDKTKDKILNITEILIKQSTTAGEYKRQVDYINNNEEMSQIAKERNIESLRQEYLAKHKETKEAVVSGLGELLELEAKNERILEFDIPEFTNTLAAINASSGKLPHEVIDTIKLNFAGHYQVLLSIRAALDNYDVDTKHYGYDEYTESAATAIKKLIPEAENLEQSEVTSVIGIKKLCKKLIHFGEVRGIKFSDEQKSFGGIDEEAREVVMRKAMGIE